MRNLTLSVACASVALALSACTHYAHQEPAPYRGYVLSGKDHARWHEQADRFDEQSDRYEEQTERYEELACRYDEFFLGGYTCHPRYYGMSWGGPYRYRRARPYGGVYRAYP
jgi:hypothetical protein